LWYLIIPLIGAFHVRRFWRLFRDRFVALQGVPPLTYQLSRLRSEDPLVYRCVGAIEAVSDEGLLWVRGEGVTAAVSMNRAQIFLVPPEGTDDGALQRLQWRQFPLVLEGSMVYVAGPYCTQDGRALFCSTKEEPLLVLLFDGDAETLAYRVLSAARQPNEYWNPITPYSLALGVFSQLLIAASYSGRPALRLSVLAALTAVFIPILPLLPPGVLLTSFYRRWWWRARHYRSYRDVLAFMQRQTQRNTQKGSPGFVPGPMAGWSIEQYENRSRLLVIYAVSAVGLGILMNIFLILFVLQNLFL
jgi:hypothetical protein